MTEQRARPMMTKEQRGLLARKLAIPDEPEDKDLPPLDAALEERLIAQTQAQLAGDAAHHKGGKTDAKTPGARVLATEAALAPVINLNERRGARSGHKQTAAPSESTPPQALRWLRRAAPVWGICAAACLGFWLWGPTGTPLATYQISVRSDAQHLGMQLGGSPTLERVRLAADSRLRIELRPSEEIKGPLEVAAYRRAPQMELQRWRQGEPQDARQNGHNGLIRVDTSVQDSGLTPGRWQLIFVIGRQRRLPSFSEVQSVLLSGQLAATSSQWQIRSVFVDIATPP